MGIFKEIFKGNLFTVERPPTGSGTRISASGDPSVEVSDSNPTPDAFGIDLGTARSGIAGATGGAKGAAAVESIPMRHRPSAGAASEFRLPSLVVTRAVNGRVDTFVGDDACEHLADPDARVFLSAKSNLGLSLPFLHGLSSGFAKPSEVLVRILELLFRRAEQHTGVNPRSAPLSIAVPASLPSAARTEILRAAARAGANVPAGFLIEEPVAVLLDALYGPTPPPSPPAGRFTAAVFDIGAGTCDVAIFEIDRPNSGDLSIRTLAVGDYDILGGDNFDLAIVRALLLPACLPAATPSPLTELFFIRKNLMAARRLKELLCAAIVERLAVNGGTPAATHPADYPELEVTGRTFEVRTHDLVIPSQTVRLTTHNLLDAVRPFLSMDPEEGEFVEGRWMGSLIEPLHFTLGKAGRVVSDLDLLILSGAACRAPFVPYVLTEYCVSKGLNADRMVYADLDQAVQRGAAIHALRLAASGKPPITPILGADIGLWVYGGRPERLIPSGTILPCAERLFENVFSVPENDLEAVAVEVYASRRGGAKREVLMRQSIELSPGTPAGEPVSIAVAVDQGKVITLSAALARHPERKLRMVGEEIWLTGRGGAESANLRESRAKVHKAVETTGAPALCDLLEWATAEYRRRSDASLKTAYEILTGILDVHPECHEAWNLMGLICETQNRKLSAEIYFRRAMSLNPGSSTYRSNLGWILMEVNRTGESLTLLAAAHSQDPDSSYPAEVYALALESNGDYEQAKAVRTQTIHANESRTGSRKFGGDASWMARLYEGVGDSDKATKMRLEAATDSGRDRNSSSLTCAKPRREALLAGPESPVAGAEKREGRRST